jgi:hypothetical protein
MWRPLEQVSPGRQLGTLGSTPREGAQGQGPRDRNKVMGQGKGFSSMLLVNPDSETALVKLRRPKYQTYGKVASWIRVRSQYLSSNIVPKVRASMPRLADVEVAEKSMVVLFSHS